jgi:hypothetical protein
MENSKNQKLELNKNFIVLTYVFLIHGGLMGVITPPRKEKNSSAITIFTSDFNTHKNDFYNQSAISTSRM